MPHDALKYLYDIAAASALIRQFMAGKSWPDYAQDAMCRSAVERQLVGEDSAN